jgi:3-phosphoshikimate 1-carboxyvinyltransferase
MNPTPLIVEPGPGLSGAFTPPGDKSITHRAWLLSLLAEGETVVSGANRGADGEGTLRAVQALGVQVSGPPDARTLTGLGGRLREPDAVLDCGNSGTTLRLLAGVLAAQPFLSVLSGDDSLRRRPVARVIEPLRAMGATLFARDGDRLPPLVIRGARLAAVRRTLPVASAQVASCVLLAGLSADGETSVEIPGPARDHTERLLRAAGVEVAQTALASGGRRVSVRGPALPRGLRLRVPGDFSAAAFFLAAAAATAGSRVTANGVGLNPTRTGLLDVLERMGARVERSAMRIEAGEEVGDVTVEGPASLVPFDVPAEWIPRLIDEVPAWVVVASAAAGVSRLAGAAELRVKESDRLHTLAMNLTALGIRARELPDGLEITGGRNAGGTVRAEGDHRIAMAFAVLGTRAASAVRIDDAASIATSYPGFVSTLVALGGRTGSG